MNLPAKPDRRTGARYAVQTAGSGGSERLIYVLRAADSHDLVLGKENNGSGFADGPGFLVLCRGHRRALVSSG